MNNIFETSDKLAMNLGAVQESNKVAAEQMPIILQLATKWTDKLHKKEQLGITVLQIDIYKKILVFSKIYDFKLEFKQTEVGMIAVIISNGTSKIEALYRPESFNDDLVTKCLSRLLRLADPGDFTSEIPLPD